MCRVVWEWIVQVTVSPFLVEGVSETADSEFTELLPPGS